eukprot:TRINITY_DN4782_c0_g2_i1.p1 TRINITY_DN4782_c0_g2~~TRINITY_DN4782_c0_g2_i1.p1  ORF type:complete len:552 (-),score=122.88 TRINITY_DN4782_c0_g2_i1:499-2154(-)
MPPQLCSKGCGHLLPSGTDRKGRPFVTCCRGCALGDGHDSSCLGAGDVVEAPEDDLCVSVPLSKGVSDHSNAVDKSHDADTVPKCLPPSRWSNKTVTPDKWAMELTQFTTFIAACRKTNLWTSAEKSQGYVNLYDVNVGLLKKWTKNTGCSIALRMNPAGPLQSQLMVSHCWGEDLDQCEEAICEFYALKSMPHSTSLWFCAFAQYQPGDDDEDIGPTLNEQLAKDPFGSVIRSVSSGLGMVVIHTTQAEVYSRLWCVYEIAEAVNNNCSVGVSYSKTYLETRGVRLADMLTAQTSKALCANDADAAFIRSKVKKLGGWALLDKKIFEFRLTAVQQMLSRSADLQRLLKDELAEAATVLDALPERVESRGLPVFSAKAREPGVETADADADGKEVDGRAFVVRAAKLQSKQRPLVSILRSGYKAIQSLISSSGKSRVERIAASASDVEPSISPKTKKDANADVPAAPLAPLPGALALPARPPVDPQDSDEDLPAKRTRRAKRAAKDSADDEARDLGEEDSADDEARDLGEEVLKERLQMMMSLLGQSGADK